MKLISRLAATAAALVAAALLPIAVPAQNTTVTHPRILNGGVPVTGTVVARPVDARGTALSIVSSDGSSNGLKPFSGSVTAGVISGLSVPDQCTASALTPNTPLWYQIVVTAANDVAHPIGFSLPPGTVCGSTYALDTFRAAQVVIPPPAGLVSKSSLAVGQACTAPYIGYLPTAPYTQFECAAGHLVLSPTGTGGGGVPLTLSTSGTGAATYDGGTGVLNIPTPPTPAAPVVGTVRVSQGCSGSTTVTLPSYNALIVVTPTANCTLAFTAPATSSTTGYVYRFRIVGTAYTVTLPASGAGQTWTGGVAPTSPASGQYASFVQTWFGAAPLDGTY